MVCRFMECKDDMNESTASPGAARMVGFVFTNFNNTRYTIQALQSIFGAAGHERCFAVVVDNKSIDSEVQLLAEARAVSGSVHVIENPTNVGYFPGLNIGIDYLRNRFPAMDLMVIGNNDLVFPSDFVASLDRNAGVLERYPVVCPDLLTLDGVHQNPHVLDKVSRFREIVWDLYFSNYFLAVLIKKAAAATRGLTERKDYETYREAGLIYQGYGACYILTRRFFDEIGTLWAPTFLMGEEFYLSKQLESIGHRFYYEPSISVQHHDHATVSKIPSKKLWEYTREYHQVYRRFIHPYRVTMDNQCDFKDLK